MKKTFYESYAFSLPKMILYFFVLIIEIYKSGFNIIGKIISGQINPQIVDIKTDLHEDYKRCILANSITLTPGTVTIDLYKDSLKVLWLDAKTKNPVVAGHMIKHTLEKYL